MDTKTVATLTNTHPQDEQSWPWIVTEEGTGTVLVRMTGAEEGVLACATACLVADHGYPAGGTWVRSGPDSHAYTIER